MRGHIFRWFGLGFQSLDSMKFVVGLQCGSTDVLVQLIRKYSCHVCDVQRTMLSCRDLLRNIIRTSLKELVIPWRENTRAHKMTSDLEQLFIDAKGRYRW